MIDFARFGNQLYTGERSVEVVRRQRTWYAVSAVLLLLSVGALFVNNLEMGLEFKGGSEFRVSKVKNTSDLPGAEAVRSVVAGSVPKVARVGQDSIRVQTDKLSDDQAEEVRTALAKAYDVPAQQITSSFVGPSWGKTVSQKAWTGLGVFLVLVSIVIALYFRTWKMAVAAIAALLHDLLITVGIYALVGFEVTPASVIGFLTILGYSLYDTVVVFDKVRENTTNITAQSRQTYSEAANLALNQTLVRSINTSVVALLPVASILFIGAFLLGAGTLKDLSLALFVGIATGTYSSVFIATPLLADLREREPAMRALAKRVNDRRSERALAPASGRAGGATAVLDRSGSGADSSGAGGSDPDGGTVAPTAGRSTGPARKTGPRNQPKRKNPRRR